MISELILDVDADLPSLAEKYKTAVKYVARRGRAKPVPILPKGTRFDGDHALFLVKTGQAIPIDEECKVACGMTPAELEQLQFEHHMDNLGVNKVEDRELMRGGVITGYDKEGKPIPGPNWESYQKALEDMEKEDEI